MKHDGKTLYDLLGNLVSEAWCEGNKASKRRTYALVRRIAEEVGLPKPTDAECEVVYQGGY